MEYRARFIIGIPLALEAMAINVVFSTKLLLFLLCCVELLFSQNVHCWWGKMLFQEKCNCTLWNNDHIAPRVLYYYRKNEQYHIFMRAPKDGHDYSTWHISNAISILGINVYLMKMISVFSCFQELGLETSFVELTWVRMETDFLDEFGFHGKKNASHKIQEFCHFLQTLKETGPGFWKKAT